MKRPMRIRVFALALATTLGCSDDDTPLESVVDAGSDASVSSGRGSTTPETTPQPETSSAPRNGETTERYTSQNNGTLVASSDDSTTSTVEGSTSGVRPSSDDTTGYPTHEATTDANTSDAVTTDPTSGVVTSNLTSDVVTLSPTSDVVTLSPTSDVSTLSPTSDVFTFSPTSDAVTSNPTSDATTLSPTSDAVTSDSPGNLTWDNGSVVDAGPDSSVEAGVSTGSSGTPEVDAGGGCLDDNQCAQPSNPCMTVMCFENSCMEMPIDLGLEARVQTTGDCKIAQCDGSGNIVPVNQDADVNDDGNECTVDACNDGMPSNEPAAVGESCAQNGGFVCDGASTCVECNAGPDCESGTCSNNECGCLDNDDCLSGMCYDGECVTTINGCDIGTASDLTASSTLTITFANGNFTYAPKCVKVTAGTEVTFSGNFTSHPQSGGVVAAGVATPASEGPFVPATTTGVTKTVTMSTIGTFPYYCMPHGVSQNMNGAIFVVPSQGG